MKERITITIDSELLAWLDMKVEHKVFANRSHGFEFLIYAVRISESTKETHSNDKTKNNETTGNDPENSNKEISQKNSNQGENNESRISKRTNQKRADERKDKNNED